MNNIVITDNVNRLWIIEFSEYTWKIFKGTDQEYIVNRLREVCSEICCNSDDFIINHDTIIGYGLYLTMIQFEDDGTCTAAVDHISRKVDKEGYKSIMRSAGIDVNEFLETKHTIKELDSIASIIVDHKNKIAVDTSYYLPPRDYNGMITYKSCFHTSQPIDLKDMFHAMMANFKWNEIFGIIYRHSIYGIAYCNAVERCAVRGDEIIYLIPSATVIFEEFRKLLLKYESRGYKLQPILRKMYVEVSDTKKGD